MNNYLRIPTEITLDDIRNNDASLSAGMYRRVIIPTGAIKRVGDLLDSSRPYDKGVEPGSLWYMSRSPRYFIRTKALQDHSYLLYPKGDSITPINPRVFEDVGLSDGDILMSKDSNVGECVVVDGEGWKNHMFSGGIVRLHPTCDRFYFLSFLKHPLFKMQLLAKVARGATITHAKTLWLDCLIPFPSQPDADKVVRYVSALMQVIVEKEKLIRDNAEKINALIQQELEENQTSKPFAFEHPTLKEVRVAGRLDAAIYGIEYKSKIWLIENYRRGYRTPSAEGFTVTPGPSLEIKILRTRIDSDIYKPGFYSLIVPMNISVYGTMNSIPYLGTAKKLPLLKQGDIVFGEAGFQKGRSIVLLEGIDNCTTNAHGLYARRSDSDIQKSIFFRCIFNWYRSMRLIDLMAVGGSGGHFSPEYFDYIRIPQFPEDKQAEIARLYHNPAPSPSGAPTLETFIDWHRRWNDNLGIWELDREMKALQSALAEAQNRIIQGQPVKVPLD
jgi:hypothetical protein